MTISYFYSIPYILLFFFFFLLHLISKYCKSEKEEAIIRYSSMLLYLLFFGFRGFIGADWNNYYPFYKMLPSLFSGEYVTHDFIFEPGFLIFSIVCKTISSSYHFFIFANSLINILLLNIFIKRYLPPKRYVLGIMIFILMSGFNYEIDLLRASKSILLFMISIKFIEEKKPFYFLIANLIGLSFHSMSIIFFPLYFFINRTFSQKVILTTWILGNIVFLTHIQYIKPLLLFITSHLGSSYGVRFAFYLDSNIFNSAYGFSLGFVERTFTFILLIISHYKVYNYNKESKIFLNIFYLFIYCNLFLGEFYIISARLSLMLSFVYVVIWPALYSLQKLLVRQIVAATFSLYLVLKMATYTNSIIYKYDNVITGIQSYETRKSIYKSSYLKVLRSKRKI